ncbi:unnamed protein product, partial [Gadus morhua 'NCC']
RWLCTSYSEGVPPPRPVPEDCVPAICAGQRLCASSKVSFDRAAQSSGKTQLPGHCETKTCPPIPATIGFSPFVLARHRVTSDFLSPLFTPSFSPLA